MQCSRPIRRHILFTLKTVNMLLPCVAVVFLASIAETKHFRAFLGGNEFVINENLSFSLIYSQNGQTKLTGTFINTNNETIFRKCGDDRGDQFCLEFDRDGSKILVTQSSEQCTQVQVVGSGKTCFNYERYNWYGGAERNIQEWPIQTMRIFNEPYVTREANAQAVLEPYWIASQGASIYVSSNVHLFIDSNNVIEGALCLYANDAAPYKEQDNSNVLVYDLCLFDDALKAHQYGIRNYLGYPKVVPDDRMSKYPIWSTWAKYKANINASIVLGYAQEIVDNGFPNSQIEIDDMWEVCYGSLEIDKNKFSNMKETTNTLREMGFRVTLWVHPFINNNCLPWYLDAKAEGRLVETMDGSFETRWWNGIAGHVDFTNLTTRQWFIDRLNKTLQDGGIDSIKLDAGESSFLPQLPILNISSDFYPDEFLQHYVDMARQFGDMIEVRVGRRSQDRGVFLRMLDKDSRWGFDNGLKSLITTLFQLNLAGYSYILPDMVGGNAYGRDKVSKELFIRWAQANVLMPALQFSIPPWDFDQKTVEATKKVLALREKFYHVLEVANVYHTVTGAPVNPPIWYLDPADEDALACNDEYLVLDRLLVAPVVEKGARSRDIYLPAGLWKDVSSDKVKDTKVIHGGKWLRNYPVALDEVPIFQNLRSSHDPTVEQLNV